MNQPSQSRYPLTAFGATGCPECGKRPTVDKDHAPGCPRAPGHPSAQSERTSSALSELAAMGSDICTLLAAVQAGATLVLTGPDPLGSSQRFGATIESATGARYVHGTDRELSRLLSDLAKQWGTR